MTRPSPLAAAIVDALVEREASLGVAESLTGGAVLAELVSVPGASRVLRGGVVAYATALKVSLLGVPESLLREHGAVHPDVAIAMARGVRTATSVDGVAAQVGIATTGVAGPDPLDGAPVGRVFVAVADARSERVRQLDVPADRAGVRRVAVDAVLELLAEHLADPARDAGSPAVGARE